MDEYTGKISKWFPDKKYGQIKIDEFFFNFSIYDVNEHSRANIQIGAEVTFSLNVKKKGENARAVSLTSQEKNIRSSEVEKLSVMKNIKFNIYIFNLPNTSSKILFNENGGDNYSLMMNRFSVQYQIKGDRSKSLAPLLYVKSLKVDEPKKKNDKEVAMHTHSSVAFEYCRNIIKFLSQRNNAITSNLASFCAVSYTPIDKLMIGIGGQSPYGNIPIMTLHHIYGLPYIPASTLKGVVRHYFESEIMTDTSRKHMNKIEFNELFGCDDNETDGARKGKIIFLDAFPTKVPEIFYDAQTPHNSAYYSQDKKKNVNPVDFENPVPLFFPAIKPVEFRIYFGTNDNTIAPKLLTEINSVLAEALSNCGIGAKTSIGYGLGDVKSN